MSRDHQKSLLDELIRAAQTIRIQQVQLGSAAPLFQEKYGEIAEAAWNTYNRIHKQLWQLMDQGEE